MTSARAAFERYLRTHGSGLHHHPEWCAQLIGPAATADAVEQRLGPPDVRDEGRLGYRLEAWPGYLYIFDFAAEGGSGFERAPSVELHPAEPPPAGATRGEVRSALGTPAETYGWWPNETWEYASGLCLTFWHGIVT